MRCGAICEQCRTSFSTCLYLVPVDGDDEIGSRREVAVDCAHPDASLGRDVAYRHFHAGRDEECGGGIKQRQLGYAGLLALLALLARRCRSPCHSLRRSAYS